MRAVAEVNFKGPVSRLCIRARWKSGIESGADDWIFAQQGPPDPPDPLRYIDQTVELSEPSTYLGAVEPIALPSISLDPLIGSITTAQSSLPSSSSPKPDQNQNNRILPSPPCIRQTISCSVLTTYMNAYPTSTLVYEDDEELLNLIVVARPHPRIAVLIRIIQGANFAVMLMEIMRIAIMIWVLWSRPINKLPILCLNWRESPSRVDPWTLSIAVHSPLSQVCPTYNCATSTISLLVKVNKPEPVSCWARTWGGAPIAHIR
ncbi:hypothetical protein MJO28_000164 [Puccinia striiformis f. sp. tritici]|uniref:Uncharacterized protein n=1 Tax=Puccinia striiformis f. sp. tritici TaxID=168172 RepID=A0ACC0EWM7_9BASI|nr:hypothetical protein MJO28_000164 [Puccinia striiformis f. sp. tritici]